MGSESPRHRYHRRSQEILRAYDDQTAQALSGYIARIHRAEVDRAITVNGALAMLQAALIEVAEEFEAAKASGEDGG